MVAEVADVEASRTTMVTAAIRSSHNRMAAVAAVDRGSLNRDNHLPQPVVRIHTQLVSFSLDASRCDAANL